MNYIDVRASQNFLKIKITYNPGSGQLQSFTEMIAVDIADCQQAAGIAEMGFAHVANADDGFGQFIAGYEMAMASQDASGNDEQTAGGAEVGF